MDRTKQTNLFSDINREELILQAKNLDFFYGEKQALDNVNMEIRRNSITAFIGPSGCGKSTFLRCFNRMNELIPETRIEGQILIKNQDIFHPSVNPVRLRRDVGMVFQQPNPFPKSIFDNVAHGPRMHGIHDRHALQEIVETSLKGAALWDEVKDILKRSALSLSGGQQQRLCIARTIAVKPEIILMDEPASALDPIATSRIEDLMKDLAQKYTILIVTHNMQQASRVSDYTAFFLVNEKKSGYMVEYGTTEQVFVYPEQSQTENYIKGKFG